MKLTAFLILIACLHVSARGLTQTVTLSMKKAPLEKVFAEIERQTGYHFIYAKTELQNSKPVDLNVKNGKLNDVLTICFKEQPLTYTIDDNYVVVKKKEEQQNIEQVTPPIDVHGKVVDENGNPVIATVTVKGTSKSTGTDENGFFTLKNVDDNATLIISAVNIEPYEVRVNGRTDLANVTVKMKISNFDEVKVTVNTGYEQIPKERATGSFVFIDSSLINRSVSTNILDRIYGVTSGLLFMPKVNSLQLNQSNINIRGRSTITSNPNPLIVVDNFPYDGDLSTINPDDVETITVLKDAAAAAIWGAFSGNGVIVITTKKGKFNQKPNVTVNTNLTIGQMPDLYYYPRMNSSDEIDVERFLFSKGFYNSALSSFTRLPVPPVVEILVKRQAGIISAVDSASQIDALRSNDVRKDLSNYFYQKAINQHYDVNISGGNSNQKYFLSTGYDDNRPEFTYNKYQRFTVDAKNTFFLLNQKLELVTGIQIAETKSTNNNSGFISSSTPYLSLADANGNALSVPNFTGYRVTYTDTAGQGKLLDWNYRPLDEIRNTDNQTKLTDYHLSLSAKYRLSSNLNISGLYNYNRGITDQENYRSQQTYFVRNIINSFTQINFATGSVIRKVPLGGIMDKLNGKYQSHNARGQVNYTKTWNRDHNLTALAGAELRKINTISYSYRLYGYNRVNTTFGNVDYSNLYPNYATKFTAQIPSNLSALETDNNFISYFGLASYTYKNRYSISGSVRRDESNIFGVQTNQKGVPLYSAGFLWIISNEPFYNLSWLPILKLRVTDGYQGNTNSNVAAVTTIQYSSFSNSYGATNAFITNLPNGQLRWEKVNQRNLAIDFGTLSNRLTGSIEYFVKKGSDLIAQTPLDPTTGNATFKGNTANMKAHGFDFAIETKNVARRNFRWNTNFILSYAKDQVTKYLVKPSTIGTFLSADVLNPLVGKPLYSIYAYRWAGLDSLGNPRGILDGKVSKNYNGFGASSNFDNLEYIGSGVPTLFGSLINSFSYKQVTLSFLISYKLGYYFRRPSLSYNSLFVSSGGVTNADFSKRWQKPGDELTTNVPSLAYPNDSRDALYTNSDILVEKGDHIRLQDIHLGYTLSRQQFKKLPLQSCQFYIYANNLGILWRANKYKIDPDYVPAYYYTYPAPKTFAAGVKINF